MISLYRRRMPMGGSGPSFDFSMFVGTSTCMFHNAGGQIGQPNFAALCLSDTQLSLGLVEDAVIEAVGEIMKDTPIGSISIRTSCPTAFIGLDYESMVAAVEAKYGILCQHNSRCRIVRSSRLLAGGSPGPRGGAESSEFLQLVEKMPEEPSECGRGIVLLGANASFHKENELFAAASQWGLDWIQTSGEWRSFAALEKARNAEFVIVTSEGLLPVAERMNERFGIEFELMPDTCRLDQVDEYYERLAERFGFDFDIERFRDSAVEAIEFAQDCCAGMQLELEGPACAVAALADLGIEAEVSDPWAAFGRPRPGGPGGPGAPGGFRLPGGIESYDENGNPLPRSGDIHYPTAGGSPLGRGRRGGSGPRQPMPPMMMDDGKPSRSSFWGYYGIYDFMRRLALEVQE